MNYIGNDIVKPFKVKIISYSERVREMHDLAKYTHPPLIKDERYKVDNWTVQNQESTASEIWLEIKDGLP